MSKKLIVLAGPDEGRVFPLGTEPLMFGRSRAADRPLTDPHASRVHFQIVTEGDQHVVVDFDSGSGTFVNGKEVDRHVLQSGDLIRIGGTHMQFVVEGDEVKASEEKKSPTEWAKKLVGETIKHYRISAPLAPGKSGYIFHAQDIRDETEVALKVLHADFGQDETRVQHFIKAMTAVMPLAHPHLLKIHGAGKTGDHCWIATEYIAGESLAAVIGRIQKASRLDWKGVTRVAVYVARALAFAHGKNLIHQNVTPQNILVGKKSQNTKLIDLALSSATEEDPTKPISAAGLPSESLPYMSPERTDGAGTAIDGRTDIYSLGATIYAMLTGKPPYHGTTVKELIEKIRLDGPHHFHTHHVQVPDELEKLVRQCLAKRVQDRPASAAELGKRLEAIAQGHNIPHMTQLDTALDTLYRDPTAPLDLAEIALLLARDEFSFLDVEGQLNELDAMANEVKPYLRGHLAHQVQGLCRYLFHEMGFRGNPRDYYDPRNSYFNQVLERRLGIPISLSAVTIAVGQRAGLSIAGIGLPGHFIVKASDAQQEVLIDPFHGGRVLSLTDCENVVRQATGVPFEVSALALEPIPLGLMVQRMLNNLKAIYVKKSDWPRSIRIMERLRQLCPHDAVLRRDLGLSYVRHGQPGKAIDHLRVYVEAAMDADDIDQVRDLLHGAMKTVAQWN